MVELPAAGRSGGDDGTGAAAAWPDPGALEQAVGSVPAGEPAMVLMAGGGARSDARLLRKLLTAAAAVRPIVVLVEDLLDDDAAAAGAGGCELSGESVGSEGAAGSERCDGAGRLFAGLIGRHVDLVPFRVEGTAKLGFPGAALGFLTLPYGPDSRLAQELEKKLKMLLRAAVGSPSALTQVLLLAALGDTEEGPGQRPRMKTGGVS